MTHKFVEPGDDARAAERVVALITRYAVRFDPVDRTFYSGVVRGLAPIGQSCKLRCVCRRYSRELNNPLYRRHAIGTAGEVDDSVTLREVGFISLC